MSEDEILAWIDGRLSKIRTRLGELNNRDWVSGVGEAGELRAKERLLEELREHIEGAEENER